MHIFTKVGNHHFPIVKEITFMNRSVLSIKYLMLVLTACPFVATLRIDNLKTLDSSDKLSKMRTAVTHLIFTNFGNDRETDKIVELIYKLTATLTHVDLTDNKGLNADNVNQILLKCEQLEVLIVKGCDFLLAKQQGLIVNTRGVCIVV
jgi:hypothetical protein